jgi:hypothetical protein
MKKFIVLLLLFLASACGISQDTTGTVVILSDKIGPTIDLEERNYYRMFLSVQDFESAVLLQRPDSSYIFKVITKKEGEPSIGVRWFSRTKEDLERIRHHVETYNGMEYEAPPSPISTKSTITAKPAPACRSCFITEFGVSYKITSPLKAKSVQIVGESVIYTNEWQVTGRHYLTSELGYIYNLNAKYSLGFTHFTGWDVGYNLRGGLKLRMRRWLNPKTSLDLSSGAILWGGGSELERPAIIGGASLNFCDWAAVNVMIEFLETQPHDNSYTCNDGLLYRDFSPRRRNVGVYLGYKLCSKPGLVLNGIALSIALVTFGFFFAIYIIAGPTE